LRERRPEGCDDLEVQVMVVAIPIGTTLQESDLIVQAFDHAETDLVVGIAVRDDALPVALDHVGKAFVARRKLRLPPSNPLLRPR